jgi:predicted ATPase
LQRLTEGGEIQGESGQLLERLRTIREKDQQTSRFGLEPDRWNLEQLEGLLSQARTTLERNYAYSVLSIYVETLESRAAERDLVAERLRKFEQRLSEFFEGKAVKIDPRKGFEIIASSGTELRQDQLSSGEYHLLYLMVAALVTQRRGTVVAIDEPEMSMHIGWQRRLIPALLDIASNAEPQFVLATHSPDIAAGHSEYMVQLNGEGA